MPPLSRPQRHAACPCGSGRPFAACCARWEAAFRRLAARLVAFAEAPALRRAAARAQAALDTGSGEPSGGHGGDLRLVEWLLQDYEPESGRGTLLGALADQAVRLPWHEEQLLFALLLAPFRAYQVSEALGSGAVLVRDLLLGAEGPAGPHGVPGGLIRSDLLVCRLVSLGATRRPGLSLLRLPGPVREELMAYLRAAYQMARPSRHVSLEDFLDRSAHLYHHFLQARGGAAGGEAHDTAPPVALAAARIAYRGTDTPRIRAALGRQPALEPAAEGEEWAWLDLQIGIPQAHVRLAGGRVEVSADTREALAAGRQFLEGVLRGLIELPGEVQSAPPPAAAAAGTGTVRGAAFLQRMLDAWAETPSAVLGGRIPQEALQTPAGRADVAAALLALERDIARQKRLGRAWVDVAPLREALGVPAPAPPVTRQSIR